MGPKDKIYNLVLNEQGIILVGKVLQHAVIMMGFGNYPTAQKETFELAQEVIEAFKAQGGDGDKIKWP